jgi:Sulfotransferase family
MDKNSLLIFLHIPKTGGTTLNSIFRKQFMRDKLFDHDNYQNKRMKLEDLTEEEKKQIQAIAGHYFYGIHHLFNKRATYFTMLRDPIDRVISSYYYLRNTPGFERIKRMTLEQFVLSEPQAHNLQTKMISGDIGKNPSIQKAMKHLQTFSIVGVTERFNETLYLLQKEFRWIDTEYKKINITKRRPAVTDLDPSLIQLIKENNKLDIQLYEYSKKLLNKRLQALSAEERREIEIFKQKHQNT